jgi:hypothetical protein
VENATGITLLGTLTAVPFGAWWWTIFLQHSARPRCVAKTIWPGACDDYRMGKPAPDSETGPANGVNGFGQE